MMKSLMKTIVVSLLAAVAISVSADNLFQNTQISEDSGWGSYVHQSMLDSGSSVVFQDGKAVVKISLIANPSATNIQIVKTLDIAADKSYKLKFKANAEKAGTMEVVYCLSQAPYTYFALTNVNLEAGEKNYECTVTVKKDNDASYNAPRSLRLFLGASTSATVTFSDVSFEEVK